MHTSRRRLAGFTLVELMIVVAIVGILAVVAVVGYRAIINNSKGAEPRQLLGSIRMAQEAYKAEAGTYVDVSASNTDLCPTAGTSGLKTGWNPGCSTGANTWAALSVNPDGPVMFGYATRGGDFSTLAASPTVATVTVGGGAPTWATGQGYWVYAQGDPAGSGTATMKYLTSSLSKEIYFLEP